MGLGKEGDCSSFEGQRIDRLGSLILQRLMEVAPLRSKTMGRGETAFFPLPTSISVLGSLWPTRRREVIDWVTCVCVGLNSFWGDCIVSDSCVSPSQRGCLDLIRSEVERFCALNISVQGVDWQAFFSIKGIDYKGDEVRVARWIKWENISPALPREIGRVPLVNVCTLGCREYVLSFDSFLKPRECWGSIRSPKVMVEDGAWGELCAGLVSAGVCCFLEEHEVFQTGSGPLLNGLFGVSKEETTAQGVEICRLIMNLVPLNNICRSLGGDIDTLPSWSMMSPFFLQPDENLLISSEDVKCFFYTMALPDCWTKYLAFNKRVPDSALPSHLVGKVVYLASRVLPMGFLNSVSLAQNVHRNLVKWASKGAEEGLAQVSELRKDRAFTVANPTWRVYLDNYDLLEKVEATGMVEVQGSVPEAVLALRQEYSVWEVPRNEKKSVQRAPHAELQGATVDGVRGVAFPKEAKIGKYLSLALTPVGQQAVSQRQVQVVCGGLVYFSMYRRPAPGSLNAVWKFIESFNTSGGRWKPLPQECRLEILRFLSFLPLVRLDFRLPMHPMVTCSDASNTGGGVCRSDGLTPVGSMVALGGLRGQRPRPLPDHGVLVIGLFDGIGAIRVALDLQDVHIVGYISVEKNPAARRVVEAHYPGVLVYNDVEEITEHEVLTWSWRFSQCSVVLIGGGPPCQGVSGLNTDRKGALRDPRSCLFIHVSRVRDLVRRQFKWAQVHALMESVSSMDARDRDIMSQDFGDQPVRVDAGGISWCHRPRLYWTTWQLLTGPGAAKLNDEEPVTWELTAQQSLDDVLEPGWTKVTPTKPFPTFTTARPSPVPGRKPAGLSFCTESEVARWQSDQHRFPPYQYQEVHCLANRRGELRVASVKEKELILGFPLNYTAPCAGKADRHKPGYNDTRLTLLGNTWSVPVVGWLINQLLSTLGLATALSPQDIVDACKAGSGELLQGRLMRMPIRSIEPQGGTEGELAFKLGNLISLKGEDILLSTPSTQLVRFHRLRASVPAKLWRWKVVNGWRWTKGKEHINSLELRAILNAVRWRVERKQHRGVRMLHLTDSLVCLHGLTRGRTSSRKLRSVMSRINALLLCSNSQIMWGYVSTDCNPADKPSRWGSRVRSKFKHA